MMRLKVRCEPGAKTFKYGGDKKFKSVAAYILPTVLAGHEVNIKTDVVESDLPLLLSLESMKKAKVKLDVENDSAEILGTTVPLNHTSSGHYCVPITKALEVQSLWKKFMQSSYMSWIRMIVIRLC